VTSLISPSTSPSPIQGEGTLLFQISISLAPWWERIRVRGIPIFIFMWCGLSTMKVHTKTIGVFDKLNPLKNILKI